MFLDNLSPWLKKEFSLWTLENFGFSATTSNEGGHVAIVINEDGNTLSSNLADIGFGFSQILPVITQMWSSSRSHYLVKPTDTSCIVIEQPELHLHPAFQAKLADVFAASISNDDSPHLIIETHSNHVVNRFGQLISEGKLKSSDVQILVFDKDVENGKSQITKSWFDEDGYLKNWPMGFFEPEA